MVLGICKSVIDLLDKNIFLHEAVDLHLSTVNFEETDPTILQSDVCKALTSLKHHLEVDANLDVGFATINATRWHSSVFLAYKFLATYWGGIVSFIANDDVDKRMTASKEAMLSMIQTREDQNLILNELRDYVYCTEPIAQFINDAADGKIPSYRVLMQEQLVAAELHRRLAAADNEGNEFRQCLLRTTIKHWGDSSFRGESSEFFRCCAFVAPQTRPSEYGLTLEQFREWTGFTAEEVPDNEWLEYQRNTLTDSALSPQTFWQMQSATSPRLAAAALFLLNTPCVVTACDSALSLEASVFAQNRNRLSPEKAGAIMQATMLGDFEKRVPGERSFFAQYERSSN